MRTVNNIRGNFFNTRPHPPRRQLRQPARIRPDRLYVFPLPRRLAPLGQNPLQQFVGRFDIGMLLTPYFGEFAFDGGLEDGDFVALEVGLDAFEVGDGFVEAGGFVFCCLFYNSCAAAEGADFVL